MNSRYGIPPESLLCAARSVDNLALAANGSRVRQQVVEDLRMHAATALARSEMLTEHRGEYATTFRLEVYVLNPDDLHRMVQEEAQKLNMMRPPEAFAVPGASEVNAELLEALEYIKRDLAQNGGKLTQVSVQWIDQAVAKAKAVKS